MNSGRTKAVEDRMGVYKRLSDVPEKHRLSSHVGSYRNTDPWGEFAEASCEGMSDAFAEKTERCGRYWRMFMEREGRHTALPEPEDCERFLRSRGNKAPSLYQTYFTRLDDFFQWMMWDTGHVHRYNPLRMAVVEYPDGAAARAWEYKVNLQDLRK